MRKICIVTGTRAEYGILSPLIRALAENKGCELQIVAANMHLSPEFGLTYREIEADGFRIDRKVEMLLSSDSEVGAAKSTGLGMIGFADAFADLSPDIIVILGDRYEMLAAAVTAHILGIPVAHLHGGEVTEGAIDDSLRHAITKLSYLHFPATEEYRQRIIQLGENPERVWNAGSLAAESILQEEMLNKEELEKSLGFSLGDEYIMATYHPVTMQPGEAGRRVRDFLKALDEVWGDKTVIITMPNSDAGGREIAQEIEKWAQGGENRHAVKSLGRKRYFSALKYCVAVAGNSSSGLIEAPSFGVPTLNIGDRQKGRARGNTVTDCEESFEAITEGLQRVLAYDNRENCRYKGENPYYNPGTLQQIEDILLSYPLVKHPPKSFYDQK